MDDLMGKIQEVLSDEESMKQLSELAASLFPSSENDENEKDTYTEKDPKIDGLDFDLKNFMKIGRMIDSVNGDKNAELLLALKPLLKEERRARVDKAVKLLKLFAVYNVLKNSGMLEEFF